jgi:hypothetical protein
MSCHISTSDVSPAHTTCSPQRISFINARLLSSLHSCLSPTWTRTAVFQSRNHAYTATYCFQPSTSSWLITPATIHVALSPHAHISSIPSANAFVRQHVRTIIFLCIATSPSPYITAASERNGCTANDHGADLHSADLHSADLHSADLDLCCRTIRLSLRRQGQQVTRTQTVDGMLFEYVSLVLVLQSKPSDGPPICVPLPSSHLTSRRL